MKTLLTLFILFILLPGNSSALEDNLPLPKVYRVIGEAVIGSGSFANDANAKRRIDVLASKLAKVGKGTVVRIEGCAPSTDRQEQVTKSLDLAKEVEKYLRTKHKVQVDLYIAVRGDILDKHSRKSVRIVVYPVEFSEHKL